MLLSGYEERFGRQGTAKIRLEDWWDENPREIESVPIQTHQKGTGSKLWFSSSGMELEPDPCLW